MKITKTPNQLLALLVDAEENLRRLPPLTSLQKAKLDHSRAIDHLYYSSKIEGTNLSDKRLAKAIHGHAQAGLETEQNWKTWRPRACGRPSHKPGGSEKEMKKYPLR